MLGEYNKNSANPTEKLNEVLHETAFTKHTYQHDAMGVLKDIQDMPNQYNYSLQFYNRFYRPEYTTIILVGDVKREEALRLTKNYFGEWKRGNYVSSIPAEPQQTSPRTATVRLEFSNAPMDRDCVQVSRVFGRSHRQSRTWICFRRSRLERPPNSISGSC